MQYLVLGMSLVPVHSVEQFASPPASIFIESPVHILQSSQFL